MTCLNYLEVNLNLTRYEKLRLWIDSDIPEGLDSMEWDDLVEYIISKVENWNRMTNESQQAILDSFRIMWLEQNNEFNADIKETIPKFLEDEIKMLKDRYEASSLEERIRKIEEQVDAGDFISPLRELIDGIVENLDLTEGKLEGEDNLKKYIDSLDELI